MGITIRRTLVQLVRRREFGDNHAVHRSTASRVYKWKLKPPSPVTATSLKQFLLCVFLACTAFVSILGCEGSGADESQRIAEYIAEFNDERLAGALQVAAMNELVAIGKPAVEPLIEALGSDDFSTRAMALKTLDQIGADAKEAIPSIEKLTSDSSKYIRAEAIDVLANLKKH